MKMNILKNIYPVLFLLLVSNSACKKSPAGNENPPVTPEPPVTGKTFKNPLLENAPDPYVVQSGNTYYYTSTLGNRIGIWKTTAMSALSTAPYTTVYTPPSAGVNSKNIWAPEFYFLDNKWYLYYTAGDGRSLETQRTFVLENENPDPTIGTWIDKGRIYNPTEDYWAIDGTVFEYNGTNYFIWSGHPDAFNSTQNLYISKMTNPYTLEGERVMISTPQYDWETNGNVNEGPEILRNPSGKIFLIYSANGCWTDEYGLGMLSFKDNGDPLNPADWIKSPDPVFQPVLPTACTDPVIMDFSDPLIRRKIGSSTTPIPNRKAVSAADQREVQGCKNSSGMRMARQISDYLLQRECRLRCLRGNRSLARPAGSKFN